ncbi:hypothetical protein HLH33_07060 [Gluconacetobacter diazotrophicus]|uniref:Flagellar hook-length control protein FliK n=1 Tax=Gluconacetobacter diazotrophicus TaxID=33996 RepID=A0A7W4FE58_GLUDI|nr:hypothetical protein [Gluconacetobacter diazotrophicus]MBB2156069.1 hypothetical protein [Gluconacetobacter diazotrophicus]
MGITATRGSTSTDPAQETPLSGLLLAVSPQKSTAAASSGTSGKQAAGGGEGFGKILKNLAGHQGGKGQGNGTAATSDLSADDGANGVDGGSSQASAGTGGSASGSLRDAGDSQASVASDASTGTGQQVLNLQAWPGMAMTQMAMPTQAAEPAPADAKNETPPAASKDVPSDTTDTTLLGAAGLAGIGTGGIFPAAVAAQSLPSATVTASTPHSSHVTRGQAKDHTKTSAESDADGGQLAQSATSTYLTSVFAVSGAASGTPSVAGTGSAAPSVTGDGVGGNAAPAPASAASPVSLATVASDAASGQPSASAGSTATGASSIPMPQTDAGAVTQPFQMMVAAGGASVPSPDFSGIAAVTASSVRMQGDAGTQARQSQATVAGATSPVPAAQNGAGAAASYQDIAASGVPSVVSSAYSSLVKSSVVSGGPSAGSATSDASAAGASPAQVPQGGPGGVAQQLQVAVNGVVTAAPGPGDKNGAQPSRSASPDGGDVLGYGATLTAVGGTATVEDARFQEGAGGHPGASDHGQEGSGQAATAGSANDTGLPVGIALPGSFSQALDGKFAVAQSAEGGDRTDGGHAAGNRTAGDAEGGAQSLFTSSLARPSDGSTSLSMTVLTDDSTPVHVRVEGTNGVTTGVVLQSEDAATARHLASSKHELVAALDAAGVDGNKVRIDVVPPSHGTGGQQDQGSGGGSANSGNFSGGMSGNGAGQNGGQSYQGNAWNSGSASLGQGGVDSEGDGGDGSTMPVRASAGSGINITA